MYTALFPGKRPAGAEACATQTRELGQHWPDEPDSSPVLSPTSPLCERLEINHLCAGGGFVCPAAMYTGHSRPPGQRCLTPGFPPCLQNSPIRRHPALPSPAAALRAGQVRVVPNDGEGQRGRPPRSRRAANPGPSPCSLRVAPTPQPPSLDTGGYTTRHLGRGRTDTKTFRWEKRTQGAQHRGGWGDRVPFRDHWLQEQAQDVGRVPQREEALPPCSQSPRGILGVVPPQRKDKGAPKNSEPGGCHLSPGSGTDFLGLH